MSFPSSITLKISQSSVPGNQFEFSKPEYEKVQNVPLFGPLPSYFSNFIKFFQRLFFDPYNKTLKSGESVSINKAGILNMMYNSDNYILDIMDNNIKIHIIALSNTNSIEISNIQITITPDTTTSTSIFGLKDTPPDTFTLNIIDNN